MTLSGAIYTASFHPQNSNEYKGVALGMSSSGSRQWGKGAAVFIDFECFNERGGGGARHRQCGGKIMMIIVAQYW